MSMRGKTAKANKREDVRGKLVASGHFSFFLSFFFFFFVFFFFVFFFFEKSTQKNSRTQKRPAR